MVTIGDVLFEEPRTAAGAKNTGGPLLRNSPDAIAPRHEMNKPPGIVTQGQSRSCLYAIIITAESHV